MSYTAQARASFDALRAVIVREEFHVGDPPGPLCNARELRGTCLVQRGDVPTGKIYTANIYMGPKTIQKLRQIGGFATKTEKKKQNQQRNGDRIWDEKGLTNKTDDRY